jgi:hypothetical protein
MALGNGAVRAANAAISGTQLVGGALSGIDAMRNGDYAGGAMFFVGAGLSGLRGVAPCVPTKYVCQQTPDPPDPLFFPLVRKS